MADDENDPAASADPDAARKALNAAIGSRVREVRTEKGLGQAETARAAGVAVSTLFRIESGETAPTVDMLARLSVAMTVRMDELLAGVTPTAGIVGARSVPQRRPLTPARRGRRP